MNRFTLSRLTSVSGLLILLAAHSALLAIPQNFGTGPFLGSYNMPAESFFGNIASWKPDAKLPGDWVPIEGQPGASRLLNPGPVFGVPADSLTITRGEDRSIKEIAVAYSAKSSGLSESKLLVRLRTNIANFTAAKAVIEKEVEKSRGGGLSIELTKATGGASLRLTSVAAASEKAPPTPAAKS